MSVALVRRFVLPVLLCCTALGAGAQQPARPTQQSTPKPGQQQEEVSGYRTRLLGVYDAVSGDPIEGAKVSDAVYGSSSLTTSTGTVSLVFLPDGGSLVRVQKIGYETQTIPVAISPKDTLPVTLVMRRITLLPTVVTTGTATYISPALRGFQERKKMGLGYFIDDSILRRNEGQQLADVMRSRMPNVNLREGGNGSIYLTRSPQCMVGGPPQVFVDGVPLSADPPPGSRVRGANVPFNLSSFMVSDFAGVEWYPSTDTAPVQYAGTSERCGVLLLWTRER